MPSRAEDDDSDDDEDEEDDEDSEDEQKAPHCVIEEVREEAEDKMVGAHTNTYIPALPVGVHPKPGSMHP